MKTLALALALSLIASPALALTCGVGDSRCVGMTQLDVNLCENGAPTWEVEATLDAVLSVVQCDVVLIWAGVNDCARFGECNATTATRTLKSMGRKVRAQGGVPVWVTDGPIVAPANPQVEAFSAEVGDRQRGFGPTLGVVLDGFAMGVEAGGWCANTCETACYGCCVHPCATLRDAIAEAALEATE